MAWVDRQVWGSDNGGERGEDGDGGVGVGIGGVGVYSPSQLCLSPSRKNLGPHGVRR